VLAFSLRGAKLGPVTSEMTIVVNGRESDLEPGRTVKDVVLSFSGAARGIAVARNGDVVPRSEWDSTPVKAGDRLEIVTAAAGG
jgi:sulfur carrier protein